MCGLAGQLRNGRPVDRRVLEGMTGCLAHRGPDEGAVWVDPSDGGASVGLGHRRLRIIDLSPNAANPMCNEDESVWIVFNGEIYNFLDLRPDLERRHRFKSLSDTEVILHLYEEQGPDCVRSLNGMFAFAIWDRKAQRLVLARDR